uniref:Peptidylamidoglycolate lyase n=1 Tax=Strigamia maritima TaxID=126957 RepID=T1J3B3_STRMM
MSGEFAHAFGKFGGGIGQLNYPWDVAVNSKHQILVADSRNHRMQLFDFSGQVVCFSSSLLHNYLPRNVSPSQLNSNFPPRNVSPSQLPKSAPRGLCFTCKDEILFSDFDLHNINFISSDLKMIRKAFGTQGDNVGQFKRPSGIGVDTEGNLIVVDSKNHRIQIFDSNGNFLHVFGKYGSEIGEFNCPTDVCVSPDGKIIVVDFENARNNIFHLQGEKTSKPSFLVASPGYYTVALCFSAAVVLMVLSSGTDLVGSTPGGLERRGWYDGHKKYFKILNINKSEIYWDDGMDQDGVKVALPAAKHAIELNPISRKWHKDQSMNFTKSYNC